MKNGLAVSSGKSHKRFSVPVRTKANESEINVRRTLAESLLAQGLTPSEAGVAIAKRFELSAKQAKKWVYNNHRKWKVRNKVEVVRPLKIGSSEVHAVQIPLITAQRCLLILRREQFKTDTLKETEQTLEDALAKAIGL